MRVERGERRLEAGDPERRRLERHLLLVRGVRRVIGGDRLDRPVPHSLQQRQPILLGAQRGVHLHVRVERAHRVVGQDEMVRSRLAARRDPRLPCAAQCLDRFQRREVEDVDATAFVAGERKVALDRDRLGDGGIARKAELGRDASLVHVAAV